MAELSVFVVSAQKHSDAINVGRRLTPKFVPGQTTFTVELKPAVGDQETYEAWEALVGKTVRVVTDG